MRRTVIVAGMHRSGTSAIAASLPLFGVQIGHEDEFLPAAAPQNSKGFFELKEILQYNERILEILGMSWASLTDMPDGWVNLPEILEVKREIQTYVSHRFGSEPLWGFKDPRICRLLPLWQEIIRSTGSTPLHLIVIRNPRSVAHSLHTRDHIPIETGMQIWFTHVALTTAHSSGTPRVFVDYDLLLESPEVQLRRIAKHLALSLTGDQEQLARYTETFLDRNLRHHESTPQQLRHPRVPGRIRDMYLLLREAASDRLADPQLVSECSRICSMRSVGGV